MARRLFGFACIVALVTVDGRTVQTETRHAAPPQPASIESGAPDILDRLPLAFEANQGQTDSAVKFVAHGRGATTFLTATGAVMTLNAPSRPAFRMTFLGAGADVKVTGSDPLPGRVNYFSGSDPAKWRTGIPTYGRVSYRDLYPGIDLVYYGSGDRPEFDLVIAPGAKLKAVRLAFDGADKVHVDPAGDLSVRVANETVRLLRPTIFQEIAGQRRTVEGRYRLDAKTRSVAFEVSAYDAARALVIDPVVVYSTGFGGSKNNQMLASTDIASSVATDALGNAFVAGLTDAFDFPDGKGGIAPKVGPGSQGDSIDVFIAKLDKAGRLVYATYLGGSAADANANSFAPRLALDAGPNVYVTGRTSSSDFPTTPNNRYDQCTGTSTSAFVSKLDDLGVLQYSTCFNGGLKQVQGRGIAVAIDGTVYVMGNTDGTIITPPAYQNAFGSNGYQTQYNGSRDLFMARLDLTKAGEASLVYSTYFGGTDQEENFRSGIAVDGQFNAYLAGKTNSTPQQSFPIKGNAYLTTCGNCAGATFVAKINPSQSGPNSLIYSTYLGMAGEAAVAVDGANPAHAYVASTGVVAVNGDGSLFYSNLNVGGVAIAVSPRGDRIFFDDGTLDDLNAKMLTPYPGGLDGRGIAVDAACSVYRARDGARIDKFGSAPPRVYVPRGESISVIDVVSAGGTTTIQNDPNDPVNPVLVGKEPVNVAVAPDGSHIWVATNNLETSTGSVWVLDTTVVNAPSLVTVAPASPFIGSPQGIVIANTPTDGTKTYVASSNGFVLVFDTTNPKDSPKNVPLDFAPRGLAVSPDGKYVYAAGTVVNGPGGKLAVIETSGDTPYASTTTGYAIGGVAVSRDGSRVFVATQPAPNPGGFLEVYAGPDVQSQPAVKFQLADGPSGIAAHPDGSRVYITEFLSGKVEVVDVSNLNALKSSTITVGQFPVGVGIFALPYADNIFVDPQYAYVPNDGDGTVSVIDASLGKDKVVGTLSIGGSPIARGSSQFVGPVGNPDVDGDGIANEIDGHWDTMANAFVDDSATPNSVSFDTRQLCGTTFGKIAQTNGLKVAIQNPAGVVAFASGVGGPAVIEPCDDPSKQITLQLGKATPIPSCGSVTVGPVLAGPITIGLDSKTVVSLPAGATVRVADKPVGVQVQNLGSRQAVSILSDGQILATVPPNSRFDFPSLPLVRVGNVTAPANGACVAQASIDAGSFDPGGGAITLTQHPSGPYALGDTTVTLTVTNGQGLTATATATVTVVDTTPPVFTSTPSSLTVEATGPGTPFNVGMATAIDNCGAPTVTSDGPQSFPLGATTVAFIAKDASGNISAAATTVTVRDTTPPALSVPASIVTDATSPAGATSSYVVSAVDLVDGARPVNCDPPSGARFAVGATTVACSSSDTHGNTAARSFTVTVRSPAQMTANLVAVAEAMNFSQGGKLLTNALRQIGGTHPGELNSACKQLDAVRNMVQAQTGKQLTAQQAATLSSSLQGIVAALGCQ